MENSKTVKSQIKDQKIQLVEGEFTPTQASEIIMSLINQKINYHKLEGMQQYESDHNMDNATLSFRIKELENEKIIAKEFISEMRSQGKKLKIDGTLILKMAE